MLVATEGREEKIGNTVEGRIAVISSRTQEALDGIQGTCGGDYTREELDS